MERPRLYSGFIMLAALLGGLMRLLIFLQETSWFVEKRHIHGTWCSIGTSITWLNDAYPLYSKWRWRYWFGYQDQVMRAIKFDRFINAGENGSRLQQRTRSYPKADYYTVEYGINDWAHSMPVGTFDDYLRHASNGTFYAEYRILVDDLRAANPEASVILCTPRKAIDYEGKYPHSSSIPLRGLLLKDYAVAIETIARHENFVVADLYKNCGDDSLLPSLSWDCAVHPNFQGYKLMAKELIKAFDRVSN